MDYHDFSLGTGRVVFWDLDRVQHNIPLREQLHELKEDLAQVRFDDDVVLDVGWYPEFAETGSFTVILIKEEDWENPIFCCQCADLGSLVSTVAQAASIAATITM